MEPTAVTLDLDLSSLFQKAADMITTNWPAIVAIAGVLIAVPLVFRLFKRLAR